MRETDGERAGEAGAALFFDMFPAGAVAHAVAGCFHLPYAQKSVPRREVFRMLFFSLKKHSREDGEATRRHILSTAVRLFAEHGYADTTSKMICREAGVNIAAVNYYFGSRDDLYRAVLDDVHEHIVNEREMAVITSADLPVEEKLERVLDAYIATVYNGQSWYARIWAHELISPSPLGGVDFLAGTLSKERSIGCLLSELTGIPREDPALQSCIITVMAPYLLMLCVQRDMARTLTTVFSYRQEDVNRHFKILLFSALRSFADRYARGELPPVREAEESAAQEDGDA